MGAYAFRARRVFAVNFERRSRMLKKMAAVLFMIVLSRGVGTPLREGLCETRLAWRPGRASQPGQIDAHRPRAGTDSEKPYITTLPPKWSVSITPTRGNTIDPSEVKTVIR